MQRIQMANFEEIRNRRILRVFLSTFLAGLLAVVTGGILYGVGINRAYRSYYYSSSSSLIIPGLFLLIFGVPFFLSSFAYLIVEKSWAANRSIPYTFPTMQPQYAQQMPPPYSQQSPQGGQPPYASQPSPQGGQPPYASQPLPQGGHENKPSYNAQVPQSAVTGPMAPTKGGMM